MHDDPDKHLRDAIDARAADAIDIALRRRLATRTVNDRGEVEYYGPDGTKVTRPMSQGEAAAAFKNHQ